jgi:hypothetical protein
MQPIRHLVVLVTGFLAGSRAVAAALSWRDWHRAGVLDPVAAANYRQDFLTDLAVAVLSLLIAGLVWWLMRPQDQEVRRAPPGSPDGR